MRVLIYVNHNPGTAHIEIHCECNGACSRVFQKILNGNVNISKCLEDFDQRNPRQFIKIKETKNAFWLLAWVSNICCHEIRNHPLIQEIAANYRITADQIRIHC